jgi:copper chaperone
MATYRIEGMTCDGCARAVARALQPVVPAAIVQVDRLAGLVVIDGMSADDAVIRSAIEAAGFVFGGLAAADASV